MVSHQVAKDEALMAATLFPKLREIDIQFNPITTRRRGNIPPVKNHFKIGVRGFRNNLIMSLFKYRRSSLAGLHAGETWNNNKAEENTGGCEAPAESVH